MSKTNSKTDKPTVNKMISTQGVLDAVKINLGYGAPNADVAEYLAEFIAIQEVVDEFSKQMRNKMLQKLAMGWEDWDNPQRVTSIESLLDKKVNQLYNNDPEVAEQEVDIANLVMMLWNYRQKG